MCFSHSAPSDSRSTFSGAPFRSQFFKLAAAAFATLGTFHSVVVLPAGHGFTADERLRVELMSTCPPIVNFEPSCSVLYQSIQWQSTLVCESNQRGRFGTGRVCCHFRDRGSMTGKWPNAKWRLSVLNHARCDQEPQWVCLAWLSTGGVAF